MGDLYANKGYPILYNFKGSAVTMPQTVILTTRRIAATKPQLIEAYLKAIGEGIAFATDPANKEIVMRLLAINLRLSKPADVEEAYKSAANSYEKIPYPNVEGLKRLHTVLMTINPKLANVEPETTVDNNFIKKLETSGFMQAIYKKR